MDYRRVFIQNAYIHVIILAYQRKKIFIENIELLRQAFKNAKKYFSFDIIAICVLPDHIHVILNPTDINKYPKIITSVKYFFSRRYYVGVETPTYDKVETPTYDKVKTPTYDLNCKLGFQPNPLPTYGYVNKGEKGIFQRRYYEHTITSQEELNKHIDYIHYNPVKHGYVKKANDWEFSSFHEFVKDGFYNDNWCDFSKIEDMNYE